MKIAYLLHARDKAKHVELAARSMFMQNTQRPYEILLSDQGSVDGTRQVLDAAAKWERPSHISVRRLDCPLTDIHGMPGLNAHINWAMQQTDADVVLGLAADDYDLGDRVELTAKAFEEHSPSMVLGGMYYVDEEMKYLGENPWPKEDGWCKFEEMHSKFVGGSTIQAWTREFFEKIEGLNGVGSPDVVMPFLACLDKGAYYIHARVHAYRKCIGVQNTGLESVYYAYPEGSPERLQYEELIHFQVSAGLYTSLRKMEKLSPPDEVRLQASYALANAILDRSASWVNIRQKMTFERVPPKAFLA